MIGGVVFDSPDGEIFTVGRTWKSAVPEDSLEFFDDDFVNTACAFVRANLFANVGGFRRLH